MLTFLDNDHSELQAEAEREFARFLQEMNTSPIDSPLRSTQSVALGYSPEATWNNVDTVRFYMATRNGGSWVAELKSYVRTKDGNYVRGNP